MCGLKEVQRACKITDSIFDNLIKGLRKKDFKTEKDIEIFFEEEAKKKGCKLAFIPVISAKGSYEDIHHKPNKTKLKKGFLIVDMGVRYKGYCADCTRTFYIGKPSKKEAELYKLVLSAQLTALREAKTGVFCSDLDAVARAALWKYRRNFVHGLGHGIGKKVHKSPNISPNSNAVLKKKDIITVEPGVYSKGFGIRIEDTIFVKDRPVVLTKTPKKLKIFK